MSAVVAGLTPQPPSMTGPKKAAILLVTLGEDASARLIKQLNSEEIQAVSEAVLNLGTVPVEEAQTVLEEFQQAALRIAGRGGFDTTRRILTSAFGAEMGNRLAERMPKARVEDSASFDPLQNADPRQLAKFIHDEHPQTMALILSHLNTAQASSLLSSLPPEMRSDVIMRMATLDQIAPEIISKIAAVVGQRLKSLGQFKREATGGVRAVADILNRLDSEASNEVLQHVGEQDQELADTIRQRMFVFDDLVALDSNGVKELLARVDRKLLIVGLKGTTDELKTLIMQGMSQRGAEMLKEDMEAAGPVKIKDVEAAQQQIIAVVKQLEAEGTISLKGGGGDEYVV